MGVINKPTITRRANYSQSIVLGGIVLVLFALYLPLNMPRNDMHSLASTVDGHIPFVAAFVLPYVSYYPYLAAVAFLLVRAQKVERLERYLLAMIISLVIAYAFYGFFQTYVERPELVAADPLTRIVAGIYRADKPFNDFPSLHATLSLLAGFCLFRQVKADKLLMAWGVLIAVSTVFVKQHYVADVIGGTLLATFSYSASRFALSVKQADR